MTRAHGALLLALCTVSLSARAETLNGALLRAYDNSPLINSGRAGVRALDEKVPQALSGMRPRANAGAFLGVQDNRAVTRQFDIDLRDPQIRAPTKSIQSGQSVPRAANLTIEQPVFDGFKTANAARMAETGVFAGRERLRLTEQRVLLNAVSAYINVLRDTAALKLQENNVAVLTEQLRQTRERYLAGQITLTDIAQAEARLAAGKSLVGQARAALEASIGAYRQTIGDEPRKLAPGAPVDRLLPKTREDVERIAQAEHPVILAALHDADAADLDIKVIEADFMPKLSVVGNLFTQTDVAGIYNRNISASVGARLNVPLYEGGLTSSQVREAKEVAGQRRLDADVARADVIALVRANWGALQAAKTQISAAQTQIAAAERALYGVREEAKAGQRTTLDILNAQLELLNARIGLIFAQRERVVASYAVLASMGRLSTETLHLAASQYDPAVHFDRVKDLWGGITTP
ncbi:TolC family outer membrane protein [Methylocystis echinoides]|uniref:Channel protein TolC n=1 Tax=Methylocystis echinoides TaxID=29468 RepID=A0A9W6LUD7_9HYPH|nr:TolC family outer membrane protein [Methylocystis echinoides]GLI95705.1 channel protein TolC [Methylocystis echinoides]